MQTHSSNKPGRPDGAAVFSNARQNLIVGLLALTAGLVFLDRLGITFVFAEIKAEMGLRNAQLGMLVAVTALSWAVSSVVFSYLSDALGGRAKLMIVSCLVIFSFVTALTGVVTSFSGLVATRFLIGVFEGPVIPLLQSTVLRVSSPKRLGTNLAITVAGTAVLGSALPPIVLNALSGSFGWRFAFVLLAVPGLVMAVLLWIILPQDEGSVAKRRARPSLSEVGALFRIRNVWLGIMGGITQIGLVMTLSAFLPLYLREVVQLSKGTSVAALSAFGLLGGLGGMILPALSDRFPRKRCLTLAAISGTGSMILLALSALQPGLFVGTLAGWMVAGGAMALFVYIIPGESVSEHLTATTYAILLTIGEIVGGATMPTIGGYIADRFGLLAVTWCCALLAGVALLTALAVREPLRRSK